MIISTENIKNQLKQFYERQCDKFGAWTFCWGYIVALKHTSLITKDQYDILDKTNGELLDKYYHQ